MANGTMPSYRDSAYPVRSRLFIDAHLARPYVPAPAQLCRMCTRMARFACT